MYYYLTFDIVCDEIENRVYSAACDLNDYSLSDMLPQLADQFYLDYPEETRRYGRDVIASTFEMKADCILSSAVSDCSADYLAIEDEYFSEGVQLNLFA